MLWYTGSRDRSILHGLKAGLPGLAVCFDTAYFVSTTAVSTS